jgi:hypothetical protein
LTHSTAQSTLTRSTARGTGPLRLSRLRMTPRRFAASHSRKTAQRSHGRPAEGAVISWLMDEPATVRVSIRRASGASRTVAMTTLKRKANVGENTIRFSARIGRRPLRPGRYRAVISASSADGRRTPATTLPFVIVAR